MSGKTPDFRDRLTILVIGVSSIGSNADVLVGYVRINFLTSSKVAGSKEYFDLSVGRRVLRQDSLKLTALAFECMISS